MRILIKESDQFTSSLHEGRTVSEYLVYLMKEDRPIECYLELGEDAKKYRVNELLYNHFGVVNKLSLDEILYEVSFEEFKNQK